MGFASFDAMAELVEHARTTRLEAPLEEKGEQNDGPAQLDGRVATYHASTVFKRLNRPMIDCSLEEPGKAFDRLVHERHRVAIKGKETLLDHAASDWSKAGGVTNTNRAGARISVK